MAPARYSGSAEVNFDKKILVSEKEMIATYTDETKIEITSILLRRNQIIERCFYYKPIGSRVPSSKTEDKMESR